MHKKILLCLCCILGLVALPCTNAHALLGLLGELDAHMSEFNPIGHHLIDPINEAVPRLHIKGFLRLDANMNLHSDDRSIGAAKINKDWRMQKIEWLAEIEASYRLTDSWQLVAVSHFLYDSVYDWQHSHGLYADRTDRTSHYYHRGEQILREFYLKGYWGNFDFYLGKQQIVWGKMEGRVIDVINPMDSRESPLAEWQADYEYRRMPLWMTNITYNWTDCSLQFLWIPDFEEGYGPLTPGAPYHPTAIAVPSVARFYDSDKPSTSFEDHEWALRFNMTKGDWEFALFYFYTWSDSPTNFMRTFRLVAPRDGLITVEVEPKHTRQHMFGAMVETGFYGLGRHWVVSNEVLYTMNKYFSVDDESLLPWNLEDGYKKRDEIFFGSRWMTSFFRGEVNVIFQPLIKYVPGYSHNHSQTGSNQKLLYGALTVISKSYEFTGDRLNTTYYCLGFFNAHPSEQEGVRQLLEVRWKVSDYIKTILYYETFNGDHQGIYGSYDKYDNIGLYIKYAF